MQNNNRQIQEDNHTGETLRATIIKNNSSNRNFLLKCNMGQDGGITTYTFKIKELTYRKAYTTATILKVDKAKKTLIFPLKEFIKLPKDMRNQGVGSFILYEVLSLIKNKYNNFIIQEVQLERDKNLSQSDILNKYLSTFNIHYKESAGKINLDFSDIYNTAISYDNEKMTVSTPDEYISELTNIDNNSKPSIEVNGAEAVLQNMSSNKLIKVALAFSIVVTIITISILVFA